MQRADGTAARNSGNPLLTRSNDIPDFPKIEAESRHLEPQGGTAHMNRHGQCLSHAWADPGSWAGPAQR
jgi:hypothetical protein